MGLCLWRWVPAERGPSVCPCPASPGAGALVLCVASSPNVGRWQWWFCPPPAETGGPSGSTWASLVASASVRLVFLEGAEASGTALFPCLPLGVVAAAERGLQARQCLGRVLPAHPRREREPWAEGSRPPALTTCMGPASCGPGMAGAPRLGSSKCCHFQECLPLADGVALGPPILLPVPASPTLTRCEPLREAAQARCRAPLGTGGGPPGILVGGLADGRGTCVPPAQTPPVTFE